MDPGALETASVRMIRDLGAGMLLSSCSYRDDPWSRYDMVAGIGVKSAFTVPFGEVTPCIFDRAEEFIRQHQGWLFFHLSYDLKNAVEKLQSGNPDRIGFPELVLFSPKAVVGLHHGNLFMDGDPEILDALRDEAERGTVTDESQPFFPSPIRCAVSREQYFEAIAHIRRHIQRGDIYELNFCQEFYGKVDEDFDLPAFRSRLNRVSPAPFSAFYRWGAHFLVSASPERFLRKTGSKLISQPMKGTIRRGASAEEDNRLKETLLHNEKERAENVMIVDLVRNDLSRIALKGSVAVPELFGMYSFPGVHQMISTVTADIGRNVTFTEILKAAFPMGSMTGAPKIRAMQLIEQYERSRRGIFSGTVGYISPEGEMDMSVVIRSLTGNLGTGAISFQTGGAITADSDPESEYAESLLKAGGILQALGARIET